MSMRPLFGDVRNDYEILRVDIAVLADLARALRQEIGGNLLPHFGPLAGAYGIGVKFGLLSHNQNMRRVGKKFHDYCDQTDCDAAGLPQRRAPCAMASLTAAHGTSASSGALGVEPKAKILPTKVGETEKNISYFDASLTESGGPSIIERR